MLEEHLIFHRPFGYDYNWEDWADKGSLPVGLAALVSFLIGWAGAIIGMDQVWWIGPAGRHIGAYGAGKSSMHGPFAKQRADYHLHQIWVSGWALQ